MDCGYTEQIRERIQEAPDGRCKRHKNSATVALKSRHISNLPSSQFW